MNFFISWVVFEAAAWAVLIIVVNLMLPTGKKKP